MKNVRSFVVIGAMIFGAAVSAQAWAAGPRLEVTPNHLSFGQVVAGTVSAPQIVTISNSGGAAMSIGLDTSGLFLVSAGDCGAMLNAGASCQASITFHAPAGRRKETVGKLLIGGESGTKRVRRTVPLRGASFTAVTTGIFVTLLQQPGPQIAAFPLTANGNVHPAATIEFPSKPGTPTVNPYGIAVAPNGTIYAATCVGFGSDSSLLYFPAGSRGEPKPAGVINLESEVICPGSVALDSSGNIYYILQGGIPGIVLVYGSGATGNATPISLISGDNTGLTWPADVAVDSARKIYVSNFQGGQAGFGSITIFAAGSNGNVAPAATITGPDTGLGYPVGVAVDSAGDIYVVNSQGTQTFGSSSVTVYSPGSNGDAAPISTIVGPDTNLYFSGGVALDSSGNIYVTNSASSDSQNGSITVYSPGSNGDVAPIRTIAGNKTGLDTEPNAIVIGPLAPRR
ncbi:MAG: hypothetical protein ACREQI_12470 [Candidatus Binataceae bacterium]